ncbi:hypothetical protein [Moraxella lacunata]
MCRPHSPNLGLLSWVLSIFQSICGRCSYVAYLSVLPILKSRGA